MPRRVNLTILLGSIIMVVLSVGVSAGAVQEEEGEDPPGGISEAALSEDEAVEEARSEFERLQWEVQAAHGARLNAGGEKQQIADDVAETQNQLAAAEERSAEARRELADTASQVYRGGGLNDLLGILVGAETFGGFTERLDLAARLLVEKQSAVDEAGIAEDELAEDLAARRDKLEQFESTDARVGDLDQQISDAETDVQAFLDELPEDVREQIEAGREQQLEADQARAQEILRELAEAEPAVVGASGEALSGGQTATEKLDELTNIEQAAEIAVAEKALQAEQARLDAEESLAEQQAAGETLEAVPDGSDAEKAAVEARRAVEEAEQAATQAAQQAEAAEKARQVAERQIVVERVNQQLAAKEAQRQVDGQAPEISNDTNGVVDTGDRLRVEGDFSIEPGATVTFEDADGTRGTAIDGVNANIRKGSIETEMLAPLENVSGGDGILDTTGELGVVDTTGIAGPGDLAGLGGLPYDPTLGPGPVPGVAGLQYDPLLGDPLVGDPIAEAPLPGAVENQQPGLVNGQFGSPVSGQPGLQPASGTPKAAGPASGNAIVAEAMSWLGTPYSFGGTSRSGISCSGLVMMAYQKLGISLPNSPEGQLGAVGKLNPGPAPAGSIVFFSEDGSGTPTHVGIANGDGTMTDANIVKGQVGITPIDVVTGYMGWGVP